MTRIPGRIEYEDQDAPRLEEAPLPLLSDPAPRWGTPALMLSGAVVLALGFALLGAGNFVADQFARATWLGWVTLGVAAAGFGLVGAGLWRELAALFALHHVDHLRADLASGEADRIMRAARDWAGRTPDAGALLGALKTVNDPDAALALLRAGPGRTAREAADALSRSAAMQVVAGIAAPPSPSLEMLFMAWRGVRLVRQVSALYGVRPGLLGTLSLLRRTAMSATMVRACAVMIESPHMLYAVVFASMTSAQMRPFDPKML